MKTISLQSFQIIFARSKRLLLLLLLLFAVVGYAMAGGSTYYSKLTVNKYSNSTGAGKVWVTTDSSLSPSDNQYSESESESNQGSSKSQTYYLFAKAGSGSTFVGWMYNGTLQSNSAIEKYRAQVTTTSESEADREEFIYSAFFKLIIDCKINNLDIVKSVSETETTARVELDVCNADLTISKLFILQSIISLKNAE